MAFHHPGPPTSCEAGVPFRGKGLYFGARWAFMGQGRRSSVLGVHQDTRV